MSKPEAQEDIVRLATAQNPVQAHIWEQALREAGIRAKLVGDFLAASVGDIPGLYPEIWVYRDDLARAEEVLRQGQEMSGQEVEEEPED
jgi:Putative prokaryotic signal transducing protein